MIVGGIPAEEVEDLCTEIANTFGGVPALASKYAPRIPAAGTARAHVHCALLHLAYVELHIPVVVQVFLATQAGLITAEIIKTATSELTKKVLAWFGSRNGKRMVNEVRIVDSEGDTILCLRHLKAPEDLTSAFLEKLECQKTAIIKEMDEKLEREKVAILNLELAKFGDLDPTLVGILREALMKKFPDQHKTATSAKKRKRSKRPAK